MPSPALRGVVADSNVLLGAVARRAAWRVFEKAPDLVIATTEVAIEEMHEHAEERRCGVGSAIGGAERERRLTNFLAKALAPRAEWHVDMT